ncbi:hypothetical protein HYDPIDRAFT_33726 [Hydnomerulius pinastri MD-312]|uniref:Uncharacterized protein n=1 Tax=Hydnomerulius pinastri MD-312 TaxID=994086 RepID=A0A0C9W8A5_9AGAM|nr:hypothetical protein HYDPIDRAFT_33726 [Hydnomerulius pinastri MD-312]
MPGLLMEYAEDELLMHSKAAMTYRCGDVMEEDDDLDDPPVQSDPSSEEFQPEEDVDDDENEESECLTEKRHIRAQNTCALIAAEGPQTPTPQPKRASTGKSKANTHIGLLPDCKDMNPTWKARIQNPSTPFPAGSNGRIRKPTASHSKRTTKDSDEEIGGFRDEDIASRRGAVLNVGLTQQNQIVQVLESDNEENKAKSVNTLSKKPRATRKPKSLVDPDKSISADVLPDWIEPFFWSAIMPTLREVYGGLSDPWDLNQNDSDFMSTVTTQPKH